MFKVAEAKPDTATYWDQCIMYQVTLKQLMGVIQFGYMIRLLSLCI